MSSRSVYLAKYRHTASQRTHFAIFIPNLSLEGRHVGSDFRSMSTQGTIINVVGEPLLAGYTLEIERNYECKEQRDLRELVFLGFIEAGNVFEPENTDHVNGDKPRCTIEEEAARVRPPPRGQDVRAPIDGVNTKRCQEWTMEFLTRLVEKDLIHPDAVDIAQAHRDAPTHGIFGYKDGK
ncbi:hypothetical protein B0I35DRAFT_436037 [Stachybotrys elegans]|uniref:Uncharacterized protein n=1 Tax=Stachybotrys elegans TaxID=80388 RepID=A0A8K0SMK2_9HYPO|nr:hypothetical protein B0I35DRAFT_436037 [Stachybotrys elegans]